MRSLLCMSLLLVAVGLTALADTNVTGTWSGSFSITTPNGETHDDTAYFVLKQNGKEITGSVGPNEEQQFPIGKGSIDGDKITIEADSDGHNIKLDLVLVADRIKGDANVAMDGQKITGKVDMTRAK